MYISDRVVVIRHMLPVKIVCDVCGKSCYTGSAGGRTFTAMLFDITDDSPWKRNHLNVVDNDKGVEIHLCDECMKSVLDALPGLVTAAKEAVQRRKPHRKGEVCDTLD